MEIAARFVSGIMRVSKQLIAGAIKIRTARLGRGVSTGHRLARIRSCARSGVSNGHVAVAAGSITILHRQWLDGIPVDRDRGWGLPLNLQVDDSA